MNYNKEFIWLPEFERNAKKINFSDENLADLEEYILNNPECGAVIPGCKGARKLRIALNNNKGKSGGARVIYLNFVVANKIYVLNIYAKSNQEELTAEQRAQIKKQVINIKQNYKRQTEELVLYGDFNFDIDTADDEVGSYFVPLAESYYIENNMPVFLIDCTNEELNNRIKAIEL